MKILFINPYYKPYLGGIERVIEKLSRELIKKNHQVGVLTTHFSFPRKLMKNLPNYEVIDSVEIFRMKSFPSKNIFPFFQVPLVWFSPKQIFQIINKFQPDVIHFMTDKWFWVNLIIAEEIRSRRQTNEKSRPRLIFSPIFHDLTFAKQILRHFNYLLSKKVDLIVAETTLEKEKIQKAYWVDERKIKILPWGVDIPEQKQSPTLPYPDYDWTSKSAKGLTILAVGRLSKHKGQAKLVQLYYDCLKKINKATQLVLIGQDEGELSRITNYELRITKKKGKLLVITKASDQKLNQWYQESDLFVLFPEYEAFGLAFLEAMAHGIPVLTHQVGALPEILKKGAILTKPILDDDSRLVSSHGYQIAFTELIKLVNDDDYRINLGNEAYNYVKENFSWEKTVKGLLNIYQEK